MAKLHMADTLHQAADVALQLLGARGYSKDTPVEWIYRYARAAKLVDGASEVHRMLLFRAYDSVTVSGGGGSNEIAASALCSRGALPGCRPPAPRRCVPSAARTGTL